MRDAKDLFSDSSKEYRTFRPKYPKELYEEILNVTPCRDAAWDCGTGNGQVASVLANYFKEVFATDINENQLAAAPLISNVIYRKSLAEKTSFSNNSFDLITVAQAIHWFNQKDFKKEVIRVLKPKGTLAIWGYGLIAIESPIDDFVKAFYVKKMGAYWNPERKYLDKEYKNISLGLKRIEQPKNRYITYRWSLEHLKGYLNTWSAVGNYKIEHPKEDPVEDLVEEIKPFWTKDQLKEIKFPIYLQLSKNIK